MNKSKKLAAKAMISAVILGLLTSCAGGYYEGDVGGVYYGGPEYVGGFWGPGWHGHYGDHDFGRRGFQSRSAAGFHGGGRGGHR